jgi:hypothetical protein
MRLMLRARHFDGLQLLFQVKDWKATAAIIDEYRALS